MTAQKTQEVRQEIARLNMAADGESDHAAVFEAMAENATNPWKAAGYRVNAKAHRERAAKIAEAAQRLEDGLD